MAVGLDQHLTEARVKAQEIAGEKYETGKLLPEPTKPSIEGFDEEYKTLDPKRKAVSTSFAAIKKYINETIPTYAKKTTAEQLKLYTDSAFYAYDPVFDKSQTAVDARIRAWLGNWENLYKDIKDYNDRYATATANGNALTQITDSLSDLQKRLTDIKLVIATTQKPAYLDQKDYVANNAADELAKDEDLVNGIATMVGDLKDDPEVANGDRKSVV